MGIFRLGAIVAVGIALLPSDREKQEQLYDRAASAAKWTITFCDRNAETCAQAGNLWQQFVAKAEFGAKLAYDLMRDQQVASSGDEATIGPASYRTSGTLTEHDLKPAWRGRIDGTKRGI